MCFTVNYSFHWRTPLDKIFNNFLRIMNVVYIYTYIYIYISWVFAPHLQHWNILSSLFPVRQQTQWLKSSIYFFWWFQKMEWLYTYISQMMKIYNMRSTFISKKLSHRLGQMVTKHVFSNIVHEYTTDRKNYCG